jgi:ribose 5-phosphate isomerase A
VSTVDQQMREAAEAAAALIEPRMRVGLGTGRTVAWFLRALADRRLPGLRCVGTSPDTERVAAQLGLPVEPFETLERLDVAVDGADQVAARAHAAERWAIKGGHGAHLREKIVAAAAERFVVIVSADKLVDHVHPPVPLELERFGLRATLAELGQAALRTDAQSTPDGGLLADYTGTFDDPAALARRLDQTPGVVGHGLFAPELIHTVIVGGEAPPRRL